MTDEPADLLYKILHESEWLEAAERGFYAGSGDDKRDGFIHLSAAGQVVGTAAKHFSGRSGLVLVALDAARLGPGLKWEPSRGGALFPHLYGRLDTSAAVGVYGLELDADGVPASPEGVLECSKD
ncbi:MAG: DUF952 domain-containing protein [Hyphomicrobiaceae bacterium]